MESARLMSNFEVGQAQLLYIVFLLLSKLDSQLVCVIEDWKFLQRIAEMNLSPLPTTSILQKSQVFKDYEAVAHQKQAKIESLAVTELATSHFKQCREELLSNTKPLEPNSDDNRWQREVFVQKMAHCSATTDLFPLLHIHSLTHEALELGTETLCFENLIAGLNTVFEGKPSDTVKTPKEHYHWSIGRAYQQLIVHSNKSLDAKIKIAVETFLSEMAAKVETTEALKKRETELVTTQLRIEHMAARILNTKEQRRIRKELTESKTMRMPIYDALKAPHTRCDIPALMLGLSFK